MPRRSYRLIGATKCVSGVYLERNVGNRATADELMQEVWFAVARDAAPLRAHIAVHDLAFYDRTQSDDRLDSDDRQQVSLETLATKLNWSFSN